MTASKAAPGIGTAFRNFDYETEIDRLKRTAVTGGGGGTGPAGPTGPAGTPGEKWFTGSGAPSGASGIVGDWYLDSVTGDFYEKTGTSAWTLRGNLKGPAGTPGPTIDATTTTKGIVKLANHLGGTADLPQVTARLDQIPAPTAPVSLNNQRITNLADPSLGTDAINRNYFDAELENAIEISQEGLDAKQSVRAASVGNVTLAGGPVSIDGITLVSPDRVLLKDQTNPAQNGVYQYGGSGNYIRAGDANVWAELPSAYVWVEQGTVNADTGWICTVDQTGTLGTTAVTWTQFSGAAAITAGAGLTKTGNTIDVIAGAGTGLQVNSDNIQVAVGGITDTMMGTGAVDLNSATTTSQLPITKGGHGGTTAFSARGNLNAAGYYSTATHSTGTTISITPSMHGLRGVMGLIVQVQDAATGRVELPDITVDGEGYVEITFSASVAANSKRVTIIG